ncbi:MAG: hypothetical protein RLZZ200_3017 [Pseudomonadota bacterium]|jgi:hypothetical protein
MTETSPQRGNRQTLYILIVMFFLPVAVAFYLYYGSDWRPVGQTNHGELITPVRPLPDDAKALRDGKWSLVYVGNGACDADCRESLVFARQTRLSLNQEMQRVERFFIATGECCDRQFLESTHPGLKLIEVPDPAGSALVSAFPGQAREHSLYIVDPLGNLVMAYDVHQPPKGLLTDLKKLLKLSHIG